MSVTTYRVVTACGTGVHGGNHNRVEPALLGALELRERGWEDAEVEMVATTEYGGNSYWLRRDGAWLPWRPDGIEPPNLERDFAGMLCDHPGCRLSPEVARDCWLSRRAVAL